MTLPASPRGSAGIEPRQIPSPFLTESFYLASGSRTRRGNACCALDALQEVKQMARHDAFKRHMNELRRKVKRAADKASTRSAADGGSGGQHINVARRTNVIVSRNIGRPGSVHGASAVQTAPIHQTGGRTHEGSEPDEITS